MGVPQGSILGPALFLFDLPDDVICDIAVYADDSTIYSKCDRASDLCQQLELASELESNLRDTVDWGKKWLVDFNAGKTQLVSFDWSNNNGSIDVKMGGSVLEEKSSFKMLGLTFSSKLDWGSYIISIAKTASKKIGPLICSIKFLSIGITLVDAHLNWLNWFHFLIVKGGLLIILVDCMIFLSPFLDTTRMSMPTVSFLVQPDSGIFCL